MTPAQLKKAEELIAKRDEALRLRSRQGQVMGSIQAQYNNQYKKEPVINLNEGAIVSLETLERWIKQVKAAHKKGLV